MTATPAPQLFRMKWTCTTFRSLDASYTCPTTVQNVVDIYYFDADDHDSCQHQVQSGEVTGGGVGSHPPQPEI